MRLKDYVALNKHTRKGKKTAFMNGKGGCGKTSTCLAEGMHLARMGYSILFIDADPQRNLSQRLGIRDDQFKHRSIDNLFSAIDHLHYEDALNELPIIIQYRYNYRTTDSDRKVGRIAIIPGSGIAEIEAAATKAKRDKKADEPDIYEMFNGALDYYAKYFDYILIDTAPNLENNIIADLVVKATDDIICPIDGVEAARGVRNLISYSKSMTSRQETKPNVYFVMIKYQKDLKSQVGSFDKEENVPNAVYRVMKETLGTYMCDEGIPELASLKNRVYGGFGRKTPYDALCVEIKDKIDNDTGSIYDYWNYDIAAILDASLTKIEDLALGDRKPNFKFPYFSEKTVQTTFEQDEDDEDAQSIEGNAVEEEEEEIGQIEHQTDEEAHGDAIEEDVPLVDTLLKEGPIDILPETEIYKMIPLKQGRAKYGRNKK